MFCCAMGEVLCRTVGAIGMEPLLPEAAFAEDRKWSMPLTACVGKAD